MFVPVRLMLFTIVQSIRFFKIRQLNVFKQGPCLFAGKPILDNLYIQNDFVFTLYVSFRHPISVQPTIQHDTERPNTRWSRHFHRTHFSLQWPEIPGATAKSVRIHRIDGFIVAPGMRLCLMGGSVLPIIIVVGAVTDD